MSKALSKVATPVSKGGLYPSHGLKVAEDGHITGRILARPAGFQFTKKGRGDPARAGSITPNPAIASQFETATTKMTLQEKLNPHQGVTILEPVGDD